MSGATLLDTRGCPCPQPVLMTKKALADHAGQELVVLVDSDTARHNVEQFLKSHGVTAVVTRTPEAIRIAIPRDVRAPVEHSLTTSPPDKRLGDHVICVTGNRMGTGPDELGAILIRAFINSLGEVSPLPRAMVFYNTGIDMTLRDSPVLEALGGLAAAGVDIMVCGTCVKYFNKVDDVAAGRISNMYEIIECCSRASHVITP